MVKSKERKKIDAYYKKRHRKFPPFGKKKFTQSTYERIDYLEMARMDLWPLKGFSQSIERLLFGRQHGGILKAKGETSQPFPLGDEFDDIENEKELLPAVPAKIERFQKLVEEARLAGELKNHGSKEDPKFKPTEFLPWYQKKGFVVPDGLIKAMEAGNIEKSEVLLKDMRKAFLLNKPPTIRRNPGAPGPTTKRAKFTALKIEARKIHDKLVKKEKSFTRRDILNHTDWPVALRKLEFKEGFIMNPKTLSNWLTEFKEDS